MYKMDIVRGMYSNLGPLSAGAATVIVPAFVPLPGFVRSITGVVPPVVWAAGAGFALAPSGDDQLSYALKGAAGGLGAAFVLRAISR